MRTRFIAIGTILLATATASARPKHSRVAQNDRTEQRDRDEEEDDNGEAKAALPIKLDDLIEVAVRLAHVVSPRNASRV